MRSTAVLLQKLRELLIHRKIVKLNRAVGQLLKSLEVPTFQK
jgi:hypothetical protein